MPRTTDLRRLAARREQLAELLARAYPQDGLSALLDEVDGELARIRRRRDNPDEWRVKVPTDLFVQVWNACGSIRETAQALGVKDVAVNNIAYRLRLLGVPLKRRLAGRKKRKVV